MLIDYVQRGDYLVPCLVLNEPPRDLTEPITRYGRVRREFLREHHPITYSRLLLTERLYAHLREVQKNANERLDRIMSDMLAFQMPMLAFQTKSNLSPAGSPQAFELHPLGGFTWVGDYDITIDEMLNGVKKPESQFAKARHLIETTLAGGAVPAVDIEHMAEEQGISPKTLNRAKSALGVISVKHGVKWYWELPIEVVYTEVGQDGQDRQDGQGSQHSQENVSHGGHGETMTALTIFNGTEG